jgi:uncharacterized membrane protein YfcA
MGILVGWLAGLLGIGGGLIIVPILSQLLVSVYGLSFTDAVPLAVATSLSTIIFTGFSSANAHLKLGNIDKRILVLCGCGIAAGAIAGTQFVSRVNGAVVTIIFASIALLIALQMLFGKVKETSNTPSSFTLIATGAVVGTLSSIMGVGGGAMLVPALCWFGVSMRMAIGCGSAGGLVLALFGSASFALLQPPHSELADLSLGYIFLPATVAISLTSVVFAPKGARYGQTLDTKKLKRIFALLLIAISVKLIVSLR